MGGSYERRRGSAKKKKSRNQNGGTKITSTNASTNKVINIHNIHTDKNGNKTHLSILVN